MTASDAIDRDNVAAIIHRRECYLIQHRDDLPSIAYPGWWCLFGGSREGHETAEQAIRRELGEELELFLSQPPPVLMACTYERGEPIRRARKIFFDVALTQQQSDGLTLREGQGMAWLTFAEICAAGQTMLSYDLGVIALHHTLTTQPQTMLSVSHPF